MGTPFLGEIRIISFSYPPKGWTFCNGQFLPINQNQALFALFGTRYGGNGQTTFALPDLRGRVAMDVGSGHIQGEVGGEPAHTLTTSEMPQHPHQVIGSEQNGNVEPPSNALLARSDSFVYSDVSTLTLLNPGTVTNVGGSQAHLNLQPYLVLNFIVALIGIFPSRN